MIMKDRFCSLRVLLKQVVRDLEYKWKSDLLNVKLGISVYYNKREVNQNGMHTSL